MVALFRKALICAVVFGATAQAQVRSEVWGKTAEGVPVKLYTLTSKQLRVQITEFGARIVRIDAPDRNGNKTDIVLGYSNLSQYLNDPKDFFGAVVGRYGNRIDGGRFMLDGKSYQVPANSKGNALHGGPQGFSSKVWSGRIVAPNTVELTLVSPDGDMGFPGTLTVHVRYTLSGNRLILAYSAATTAPTVLNLTNHSYFNLAGESSGDVLQQRIRIDAASITPINTALIPTGQQTSVAGTPFDFRIEHAIGERINADNEQLRIAGGYDHNFVLNRWSGALREAAFAEDPQSGRTLTVLTTEPGVQFYSGNFLNGSARGYSGVSYTKHAGFCLETQHFPDSPNQPSFPSTTLRPGHTMHTTTVFVFGVTGHP